jgi:hypothetical protein
MGGPRFQAVPGHSRQKKFTGSHLNQKKSCAWWFVPEIPARAGSINKWQITVPASLGKKQDPISKITREKRAGGVTKW